MITLRRWSDLEKYGIEVLTGEACAYGYRLLCDVTTDGEALIKEALGVPNITLAPAWNSKGIGSVMLSRAMFETLAIFACWKANCKQVFVMYDDSVCGVEADDKDEDVQSFVTFSQGRYCEECHRYGAGGGINLTYRNPGYSRNVHQMSGRTT